MRTHLSRKYAGLLADQEYQKIDWFEVALRRLGGITKAARLIHVSESRIRQYRQGGWSSLTSDQMVNIAKVSGVPMLGLIVQCNQELGARNGRVRRYRTHAEASTPVASAERETNGLKGPGVSFDSATDQATRGLLHNASMGKERPKIT
jgi:hypothetical protein